MSSELILISEYCSHCQVEPRFIVLLEEEGLIETVQIDENTYIHISQLNNLERFVNLHYELSVNIEGIDIIHNLQNKIRLLEDELTTLHRGIVNEDIEIDIFE